jgi:hypothetical protein
MSYRRPGKTIHGKQTSWAAWREQHRSALERTGLPDSVLQDEEHWWDFLEHGHLDHHPDPLHFSIERLSLSQRDALRDFLEAILPEDEKKSAIALRMLEPDAP